MCVCRCVCVCVCKVNVVGEQPKTQPAHYDNQPPPPCRGGDTGAKFTFWDLAKIVFFMCKNFTTNNPGLTKTLQPVNGGRVKEISFSGHGASHIRHYFLCVQCAETRAIHCHTVTKAFCCSEPLKNFITKSSCLFMKILPTMIANFCGSIMNCIMANI